MNMTTRKGHLGHAALRLAAPLLIAAGAMPAAQAADAESSAELPTVTVYGHERVEAAREAIEQTPGGVAVIDAESYRDTPARTLKDIFDYTPGVIAQPKWGEDTRLSIRGSGLSRNFHLRGVQLYQDGVPLNAADGSADFQEIDPTAFRYTEVYKGGNGLRFGANTLGGAINFVTATAADGNALQLRSDAGSFDFYRVQASGGRSAGAADGFLTASWLKLGGYRDHSAGESKRAAGNLGYRFDEHLDTRFYFSGGDIKQQIPGSVTRQAALHDPRPAAPANLTFDYHRNMRTWRVANKTTLRWDGIAFEVGASASEKQLIHPIFQFIDYEYHDFAGFGRATLERPLAGLDNRFTVGVNLIGGWIDNTQFQNLAGGQRGNLLSASRDKSDNSIVYAEDALRVSSTLTLIAAAQYVDAARKRDDRFNVPEKTSGKADYEFFNPKAGLIWQFTPRAQAFANVSRSGEAPSFGELNFTNAALADTRAQRATTVEAGTRGAHGELSWDLTAYRAELKHEFLFINIGGDSTNYQVSNADQTLHQGIEAGLGWQFARDLLQAADGLTLNLAWTYSEFRFDGDAAWGNNDLPGAPRNYLRSEIVYRHPAGFFVGPNLELVPRGYFVDNANTTRTVSYQLLGLRTGYDDGRRWSVYVDGRNLADQHYIASTSTAAVATPASTLYEPGSGLSVSAGFNLRW